MKRLLNLLLSAVLLLSSCIPLPTRGEPQEVDVAIRTPLGTATGTFTATLANVTLPPHSWLVVGHAQHQADQSGNPYGSWNGIPLVEFDHPTNWEKQHGEVDCRIFGLYTDTGGTGDIVMADDGLYGGGTPVDGMAFWASAWTGLKTLLPDDARTTSLGHPPTEYLSQTNFSSSMGTTSQADEVMILCEVVWRPDTDLGTLNAEMTLGQLAVDTHGSSGQGDYVGLQNLETYRILSVVDAYTTSVTRSTGSEWILQGGTLRIAPPTGAASVLTVYETGIFPGDGMNMEVIAPKLTQEQEQAIWRGDRRHYPGALPGGTPR